MSPVEQRTSDLKEKLLQVEHAIEKQAAENKQLLASLLARLREKSASVHHPPVTRPTPALPPHTEGSLKIDTDGPIAVLVFACNRPEAIRNHLNHLLR